jgi:hypothetical protein
VEQRRVLPRLYGRGVHKWGKRASSPLWPLAEVKRVGEVRRCGLSAGKKTRAAARCRGSRGSRGCRRSRRRRVRFLPRAAPGFAADGSSHGRLLFSFSSPSPPSPPAGQRTWQGSNSPRRLGLGSSRGSEASLI